MKLMKQISFKEYNKMKQLIFLLYLKLIHTYNIRCPGRGQWIFRSSEFCQRQESYVCLYNVINNTYSELCNGPRKDTGGDKTVINIKGKLTNIHCSDSRYQPEIFRTTEGSDCVYQKSSCSEEGQIIGTNGTSVEDRTCRCDYTRGYAFVSDQRDNHCFCRPADEDCSCYVKTCAKGKVLSPDYSCIVGSNLRKKFRCSRLSKNTMEKSKEVKVSRIDLKNKANVLVELIPIIVVLSLLLGLTVLLCVRYIDNLMDMCVFKDSKIKSCYFCERSPDLGCSKCEVLMCHKCRVKHHSMGQNTSSDHYVNVLCQLCTMKPVLYRCHTCKEDICDDCKSQHQTTNHLLENLTNKYIIDYNITLKGTFIKGIQVLADGLLVIADMGGDQLIICSIKGEQKGTIPLKTKPSEIDAVNGHTVIVLSTKGSIMRVDVNTKEVSNVASGDNFCSIAYNNEQLYVGCIESNSFTIHTVPDGKMKPVSLCFRPTYIRLASNGHIYGIDSQHSKLYCLILKREGTVSINSNLKGPRGLTIDEKGHILVVCHESNDVHRISPDDSQEHVVISQLPFSGWDLTCISYDPESKSVIIGLDDTVFVYKQNKTDCY